MDDLVYRKSVKKAVTEEWDTTWAKYSGSQIIDDTNAAIDAIPSVPAVPLEPLCEWLADNAYMYLSEEELDNGWSSHDPAYWEMKLSKWMEGQDAAD